MHLQHTLSRPPVMPSNPIMVTIMTEPWVASLQGAVSMTAAPTHPLTHTLNPFTKAVQEEEEVWFNSHLFSFFNSASHQKSFDVSVRVSPCNLQTHHI